MHFFHHVLMQRPEEKQEENILRNGVLIKKYGKHLTLVMPSRRGEGLVTFLK